MVNRRCPWCGRKNTYPGIVKKKATPRLLTFTKCGCCNNYYGQNIYTKKGQIAVGIILLSCFLVFLLGNGLFFLIVPGVIVYLLALPMERMTEDEYVVEDDAVILTAKIVGESNLLQKNDLYFFSDNFDNNPFLENASPIRIKEFNKEDDVIKFSFLYESENNEEYMKNLPVCIYDTNMEHVGEIVISNQ